MEFWKNPREFNSPLWSSWSLKSKIVNFFLNSKTMKEGKIYIRFNCKENTTTTINSYPQSWTQVFYSYMQEWK
jgi:hypothetical protein